jgi:hypothetical protein
VPSSGVAVTGPVVQDDHPPHSILPQLLLEVGPRRSVTQGFYERQFFMQSGSNGKLRRAELTNRE